MLHNVIINYTKKFLKIKNKKRLLPVNRRKDDLWLVSFPKSGNTWMRFILGNIMIKYCEKNTKMTFNNMQNIIPDIYIDNGFSLDLGFSSFPRIIKTHENYNKNYHKAIYMVRDPKDVMVSYYHFLKDGHKKNIINFSEFLKDKNFGLEKWCKNVKSWHKKANILIKFENLKISPEKEIKKIITFLNLEIKDNIILESIYESNFKKMKEMEDRDNSWKKKHNLDTEYKFMRKGEMNEGINYFSEKDKIFFKKIMKKNKMEKILKDFQYEIA